MDNYQKVNRSCVCFTWLIHCFSHIWIKCEYCYKLYSTGAFPASLKGMGAVIKRWGLGISPGYYESGPWLLSKENRRKKEPKETLHCLIPHLKSSWQPWTLLHNRREVWFGHLNQTVQSLNFLLWTTHIFYTCDINFLSKWTMPYINSLSKSWMWSNPHCKRLRNSGENLVLGLGWTRWITRSVCWKSLQHDSQIDNHDNYSNPKTQVRAHYIDFGVGLQKA